MPSRTILETDPEIRVELVGTGPTGPAGPPGHTPAIGENGSWWIGGEDTGVPASGGPVLERITNSEMEELLK